MAAPDESIDALRRYIDRLDDAVHDLLMRRAELAERIGDAKRQDGASRSFMRAGREALIMRHLLARHDGSFPRQAMLRIWREIISGTLSIEGPQSLVMTPAGDDAKEPAYRDMVRDYFGSGTPLSVRPSAQAVLDDLESGSASIGVLPVPQSGVGADWWRRLAERPGPRIVVCLPVFGDADAGPAAYALAMSEPEPSGDDSSVLVVRCPPSFAPEALCARLAAYDLEADLIDRAGDVALVEVAGFVEAGDERLVAATGGALSALSVIGAFACPLEGAS
jgi:chorismate mutase/prephenate dehydratase